MPGWLRLRGIGFANCIPLRLRQVYSRPGDIERYPTKSTLRTCMLYTIQCQTCKLAFNGGNSGGRFFAHCGDCGASHEVLFCVEENRLHFAGARFDSDGPRTISHPAIGADGSIELAFYLPVANHDAMTECSQPGLEGLDVADAFDQLHCGVCDGRVIRLDTSKDTPCPRCHRSTLKRVGSWL